MDVRVHFPKPGRSVRVRPGTLLIDAVRAAELPIASACGAGGLCGRCGVEILAGAATLRAEASEERDAKQRNRIAPQLRLACRVHVGGDLSVSAPYW
jgi:adenylate cyclase